MEGTDYNLEGLGFDETTPSSSASSSKSSDQGFDLSGLGFEGEKKNPVSQVSSPSSSVTSEEKPSPYAPQSIGGEGKVSSLSPIDQAKANKSSRVSAIKDNTVKTLDLEKSDVLKKKMVQDLMHNDSDAYSKKYVDVISSMGYSKNAVSQFADKVNKAKKDLKDAESVLSGKEVVPFKEQPIYDQSGMIVGKKLMPAREPKTVEQQKTSNVAESFKAANALLTLENPDAAINMFNQALGNLSPKTERTERQAIMQGDPRFVSKEYNPAFNPAYSFNGLGAAYLKKKDYGKALDYFQQALDYYNYKSPEKTEGTTAGEPVKVMPVDGDNNALSAALDGISLVKFLMGDKAGSKDAMSESNSIKAQNTKEYALTNQISAESADLIQKQKRSEEIGGIHDMLETFISGYDPENKLGTLGYLNFPMKWASGIQQGGATIGEGIKEMGQDVGSGLLTTVEGLASTAFASVPAVTQFNAGISAVKDAASVLPKAGQEAVSELLDMPFQAVTLFANSLGYNPDEKSDAAKLLRIADIVASFKTMSMVHGGSEMLKDAPIFRDVKTINDLKTVVENVAKKGDPNEIKQVNKYVEYLKSLKLADIKKSAAESGDNEIVSKINNVQKVVPHDDLHEKLAQLRSDVHDENGNVNPEFQKLSPDAQQEVLNNIKSLEKQIAEKEVLSVDNASKIAKMESSIHDLDSQISDTEKKMSGLSPATQEVVKRTLNDLKEKRDKLKSEYDKMKESGEVQVKGEALEFTKDEQDELDILSVAEQKGRLSKSDKLRLTELKEKKDAVQKQGPSGLLQYPQEGIGETGSERGGMEPGVEGAETAQKGEGIPAETDEGKAAKEVAPGKRLFSEAAPDIANVADSYKKSAGITHLAGEKIYDIDVEEAKKRADAYEAMKNEPNNPEVKAAYDAMAKETLDQHQHLLDNGYKVEIFEGEGEPYKNSDEMLKDLKDNKHLYVLSTEKEFGQNPITEKQRAENPLLRDSGFKDENGKPLLVNDVFRFVHDAFGHGERGNSFGAKGEENAWDVHARMYSPLARRAMTTETRGQNSWVNFGKHLRDENGNIKKVSAKEKPFAEQKMGLLPEWASELPEEKVKRESKIDLSARALKSGTKEEFIEAKKNELRESEDFNESFEKDGVYDRIFGDLYDKMNEASEADNGKSDTKFNAELDQNISDDADRKQVEEAISNVLDNPNYSTSETVNVEEELGNDVPTQKIEIDPNDKRPEAGLMSKLRIPLNYILGKVIGIGMSDTLMTGEREVDVIDHKTGKVERKTVREEGGIGYPFKSLMDVMNGVHKVGDKIYGWAAVGKGAASAMINAAKKATKITGKELKQHYFEAFGLDKESLTSEQQAQKDRLNKAIPDDKEYGIVGIYKMGEDGIKSNEAFAREAFRQIDLALDAKEKKVFWEIAKKRLDDLEWLDKNKYKSLIQSAKNFDELYEILAGDKSQLPLGVKTDVLRLFLSTEGTTSSKEVNPIGDLLKSKGITEEGVARSIEEPIMRSVDKGQLMITLAIDPESSPVEDKNRSRHKNYPYGVEGFPIGLMQETAQFHNLSPEMMDTFVKSATSETDKTAKVGRSKNAVSIYQSADGKFYAELGTGAEKIIVTDKKGNPVSGKTKEELVSKLSDMKYKISESVAKSPYTKKINGTTFHNLLQKAKKGLIQIFADPKASAQQKLVKYLQKAFPSIVVECTASEFAKMESDLKAQKLFNKNGKAYGFVKDGRIYMDPTYLNNNTPIHEFGHVWNAFAKNYKPEIYKRGIELVTGSKYHDFVLNSAQYQKLIKEQFGKDAIVKDKTTGKITINESAVNIDSIKDYIADEALAKAIGDKGELFVNEAQRRTFTDWMNTLYKAVKQITGFEDITPEQLRDLPLNKFVDAAVKDILGGKKVSDMTSEELAKLSKDTGLAKFKAAAKKVVDLITGTPKEKYMTDDGEGNYVFYHYSAEDLTKKGINPEKFGKNLATGRDERPAVPQSFYYTEHDALELNVPHDFGHAVRIPKDKVYPFNEDPLNLLPEAEKLFKKENPKRAFDLNNQVAYVDKVARGLGYKMTVADWNIKGRKALRAQSGEAFKPELATRRVPGTMNQTEDFGAMMKSNRYKRNLGESAKSIADNIRKGKLGKDGAKMSLPLVTQVWDGSLEVVAKTIEAGGQVAEAIEKGIEYLKNTDYYKGLSENGKKNFEARIRDHVNELVPAEAKGTAEMFDALDKMREDVTNGEGNRKLKKREIQQYLEDNPEIAYIDKNFSLITKQLETLGELKKSSAECP